MLTNWDNLVDAKESGTEQAVTDTGKTVTRSTSKGRRSRDKEMTTVGWTFSIAAIIISVIAIAIAAF